MAKDLSQTPWHGVPRQQTPWVPTVEADACIGCELCYVTCGREVYEIEVGERPRAIRTSELPHGFAADLEGGAAAAPAP